VGEFKGTAADLSSEQWELIKNVRYIPMPRRGTWKAIPTFRQRIGRFAFDIKEAFKTLFRRYW